MIRPKKALGQHFLTDQNISLKIAASLPVDGLPLLEVGPGTGMLTRSLIKAGHQNLFAIEIDTEAAAYIRESGLINPAHLFEDDILRFEPDRIFSGKFNIIGNFPYNISSQIFFRILANRNQVETIVCMLQKEVAVRIATGPGSKEYGILSVLLQAFYSIEYLFTVSEHVFFPPPKVKSGVIRLKRNDVQNLDCNEELFIKIVKTAFNQRRKTLRNALKVLTGDKIQLPEKWAGLRAEQLSTTDFINITRFIQHKEQDV